jgi:tetratricopeptide (TPR) repeat protein
MAMNPITIDQQYYENLFQRLKGEDFYLVIKRHYWRYKLGWETVNTLSKKYKEFIDDIYDRQQILKKKKPDLIHLCREKWEESETAISNAHRKNRSNDFENCIDDLCHAQELLTELEKLEKAVTDYEDAKNKLKSLRNLLSESLNGSLPIITLISSFLNKAKKYIKIGDIVKAQLFLQIIGRDLNRLLYLEKDPFHKGLREKRLEKLEKEATGILEFAEPIRLVNKIWSMKENITKLLSKGYLNLCDEMLKEAERYLNNAVYCMQQIIRFQTILPNEVELNEIKNAFRTGNQETWRIIGDQCIQKINSICLSQLDGIDGEINRLLGKN